VSKIAFLGLGRMGMPMARRALDAGYDLTVWNRTPDRMQPLLADGAKAARTPAEAAAEADIVLTMLANPQAVETVIFGPGGVAEGIRPAACLVEMSTIGPDAVRALRDRLPAEVGLVDAPVMGSVGPAANGTLTVLAGGDIGPVAEVLSTFGRVVHCGGVGTGAARKIVLITAALAGVTLVGEVLALADRLGVPDQAALEGLSSGPLAGAVKRVQSADSDFPIALAAKDLGLGLATDAASLPQISAARDWLLAAAGEGAADEDLRHVVEHIRAALTS
jgi:3-hydroxyisobutyrate dehydrogenase-like beta-hydroxyacid dehydrogenase